MSDTEDPPDRIVTPIDRAFLTHEVDATELILVRHGQQDFPDPATAKVGDWIDPPLSELGRRQAQAVARVLGHERVDAVYASHLLRAHATGAAIAERRVRTTTSAGVPGAGNRCWASSGKGITAWLPPQCVERSTSFSTRSR